MDAATKVRVVTKFPKRDPSEQDQTYLCYEETTPPWDHELFFVQDISERNWFCHALNLELTANALMQVVAQIKEDYTPRDKKVLQRRLHNPLVIQIVLCRAATLDELRQLLSAVEITVPF